jgi:predicted ATPase
VLVALSRNNPLLIIFDDLQWIDNASSNLLFHLIRNMSDSRIFILGMYRPSEVFSKVDGAHPFEPLIHEVKTHHGDTEIDLDSISESEAKAFVDAFLDSEHNQLDASFRKNLFAQTRGHPLFTIELLRTMQEQGDLKQLGKEGWVANADLKWGKLPAQVEGVIEARLARLDDWSREILEVASVIGEEFDSHVLAQALNRDEIGTHKTLVKKLGGQHRLVLDIEKKTLFSGFHTTSFKYICTQD